MTENYSIEYKKINFKVIEDKKIISAMILCDNMFLTDDKFITYALLPEKITGKIINVIGKAEHLKGEKINKIYRKIKEISRCRHDHFIGEETCDVVGEETTYGIITENYKIKIIWFNEKNDDYYVGKVNLVKFK